MECGVPTQLTRVCTQGRRAEITLLACCGRKERNVGTTIALTIRKEHSSQATTSVNVHVGNVNVLQCENKASQGQLVVTPGGKSGLPEVPAGFVATDRPHTSQLPVTESPLSLHFGQG